MTEQKKQNQWSVELFLPVLGTFPGSSWIWAHVFHQLLGEHPQAFPSAKKTFGARAVVVQADVIRGVQPKLVASSSL